MPAQRKVPNAIQKALEIRRNSLPRTSESTSEPNLSETAAKQGCSSRLNRKSEIPVSVRSTVRVVVKRLPCRNFELRYLKARIGAQALSSFEIDLKRAIAHDCTRALALPGNYSPSPMRLSGHGPAATLPPPSGNSPALPFKHGGRCELSQSGRRMPRSSKTPPRFTAAR